MTDFRDLPPLSKADAAKIKRPEKVRQTLLAKMDTCHRSAALYLKYDGGIATHATIRGTLFHEAVERALKLLIDQQEPSMPGDVAKDLMQQVILEHPELPLPEYEQDALRLMIWNWAEATVVDPECLIGVEQTLEAEVGGWTITGTLDFAEITPFGYILVRDLKTSLAISSIDEIEHGRRSFQGRLYSYLALFGKPAGEDFTLGEGINEVRFELAYPRYTNQETGELISRETVHERSDLADFGKTLESHLNKLEHGLETGKWQAVPGSHCAECPCQKECPLPKVLRDYEEITPENAAELAMKWDFTDREQKRRKKSLRAYADENGAIPFGTDLKMDFREQESRIVDWDGAALNGGLIDPEKHVQTRVSTVFEKHVQTRVSTVFEKRRVKPDG